MNLQKLFLILKHLVTGGAGFLGSHLVDKLMKKGEFVYCLDNFMTGDPLNVSQWKGNKNFEFINHDITNPISINVDKIWHLACPASPKFYQKDPIKTTKISFLGTLNMLGLAKKIQTFCWRALVKFMGTQRLILNPRVTKAL